MSGMTMKSNYLQFMQVFFKLNIFFFTDTWGCNAVLCHYNDWCYECI